MWTDEQDGTLTKLWDEGKSASEIGTAMKITRNAVLGRLHRLRKAGTEVKEHVREPGTRQRNRDPRSLGRPRERIVRLVKPCKPPRPTPLADTLEGSVSLDERTGCKWPVTGAPPHRFCNRATEDGAPYCGGHSARAYQPREMKRRASV